MASDSFIKIGSIKGESTDDKHKDEIPIESWSWGASNPTTISSGGGGGAGKGTPQNIVFTHFVDKSTPNLLKACANGEHFTEATMVVRKAGKEQQEYLTIKLEEVFITNVQTACSAHDDRPIETVSLAFAKIDFDYKEQKQDGTLGGSVKMKWDIKANKVT